MKLPIFRLLNSSLLTSSLQTYSDNRSRTRSERARQANRVRYRRQLIVGELLEERALLAPLIGTYSIGPSGDNYATIGAAIASAQTEGLGGAVTFELQSDYVGTVETYPLVFSSLGTTVVNTLTLRPASDVTSQISLSSADTTAATVDLNGAQFIAIDGRPGGVGSHAGSGFGTASQLTIENTSTSGVALRFINEASSNTIRYTTLRGVNTVNASGVVLFGTTTGANGNDSNTLDHCDIRDGSSTPKHGIYSLGNGATTAQNNSGNTVSNCNIFNFYTSTNNDSTGVRLEDGNTDWTVSGNSFYQTASRAALAANRSVRAIYANSPNGNNFTVIGNFIGGSAANTGGTAWTTTGTTAAYLFQ